MTNSLELLVYYTVSTMGKKSSTVTSVKAENPRLVQSPLKTTTNANDDAQSRDQGVQNIKPYTDLIACNGTLHFPPFLQTRQQPY